MAVPNFGKDKTRIDLALGLVRFGVKNVSDLNKTTPGALSNPKLSDSSVGKIVVPVSRRSWVQVPSGGPMLSLDVKPTY